MKYETLLLDFDHTLFDSDASEAAAFEQTLSAFGIADPASRFDTYSEINLKLWSRVERGEIQPDLVRWRRFELFATAIGLDADPMAMADEFSLAMGAHGDLYPGARQVLDQLAGSAKLALITNGITEIQQARIDRLGIGRYFDAISISEEIGSAKPGAAIFDVTFERLGRPATETALMIGDSLSSDIRGGSNYGVATCWYNPGGSSPGPDDSVTYEVAALDQLPHIAAGDVAAPVPGSS